MTAPVRRPADAAELAEAIRAAAGRGERLRLRGAGSWMQAGHPVAADAILALDAFAGVRAYTPGDLTISVGAATTLAELDAATRTHGQWCPLLAWGDDAGTVGATVATATDGPAAAFLGRPRDLVLGLEGVDGTGRRIAAGGRVVKNVAGFDLTRALTGSWGTLAALTAVHLRLRARPAVDVTLALPVAPEAVAAVTRGPLAPIALVALDAADSRAVGPDDGTRTLLRLGGNAAFVAEARAALAAIAPVVEVDADTWTAVRARCAPPDRAVRWRWDALSRRLRARFDPAGILNPGLLGPLAEAAA